MADMFPCKQMATTKSYREGFEGIEWDNSSSVLDAKHWDKYIYKRFLENVYTPKEVKGKK
jgi:hypothetical protein